MTYPNLRAEMARSGIKGPALAERIGIKYPTFYKKITGISYFTLPECLRIKEALGVKIPIETLFDGTHE